MTALKLLVADDSVTIQKVIRLALSNEGYDIQTVADGNNALQQIAILRPDIVLIDVTLPGRNAFEVKKAINEDVDLNDVRFVLMSSAFEKVDEAQAHEVGFHARLTKPFDPAHLREVLSQVIATRKILPSSEGLSLDDDIRRLTESTIRITNLGDFETLDSNQDQIPPPIPSPKRESPQFEPTPLDLDRIPKDAFEWSVQEPKLKPSVSPRNEAPEVPFPLEDMDSYSLKNYPSLPLPTELPPLPSLQPSQTTLAEAMAISEKEIEKMVSERVEEALRKITQGILPGVIEKIVKEEIHRLLSEQP